MPFHIAIDGPVAAGKGTVSRQVAERLGLLYIDTGAMYRVSTLIAHRHGIALADETQLVAVVDQSRIEMHDPVGDEKDGRLTTVILNGEDVSWEIRTERISRDTPSVAQHPALRHALVVKQQEIAATQDVVMEGRDITYRVLPEAQLKIYLTASDMVRAERRQRQLQAQGVDLSFDQVYKDLCERDEQDTTRSVDPLQVVPEAWVLDTSELTIAQVVEMIVSKVQHMRA